MEEHSPENSTELEESLVMSSLYWHIFCHCTGRKLSFCGERAAEENDTIGGPEDGAPGVASLNNWDDLGEFCNLCVSLIADHCPMGGCSCGECQVLTKTRRTWNPFSERLNLRNKLNREKNQ